MSHETPGGDAQFSDFGLSSKLLGRLAALAYVTPTPIQTKTIPLGIEGKDVIGLAQTGTGKTLAFALPMLHHLGRSDKKGLVIVPTRELAAQVAETFQKIGDELALRGALLIGGAAMSQQFAALSRDPHILVGTPGRILDHLERGPKLLSQVGVLVLDEADRMLDMGFAPQIKRILEHVPRERQTLLFSATMPPEIGRIAATHMKNPVKVEVARSGTVAAKVDQKLFLVEREQKNQLLGKLLGEYKGTVLVFSRTKYGAKRVCRMVQDMDHTAAEIHSNLTLSQRRRSLEGFKCGTYRVLVATDIAARGLDVTDIELVINYDLPEKADDYVHRVGRTGRAGKTGQAISFVTRDQRGKVREIERLTRVPLSLSPLPKLPPAPVSQRRGRPQHSRGRQVRFEERSPRPVGRRGRIRVHR